MYEINNKKDLNPKFAFDVLQWIPLIVPSPQQRSPTVIDK